MHYRLAWDRGPSAVIDVQQRDDALVLRYDGPFRLTLRPLLEAPGTPDDLQEPVNRLRDVAGRTGITDGRGGAAGLSREELLDNLAETGDWLCRTLLPRFVAAELASQSIFLEVGTDETLLPVPFELMRDEADFVCLRHAMGRYVSLGTGLGTIRPQERDGDLSVLLICVPKPQPVGDVTFVNLAEAEAEYQAVSALLMEQGIDFVPLHGPDATKREVMNALKGTTKFTVVHFTGHGHTDEQRPGRSGLVLFDGILTIGEITSHLDHAPALAFINGCETATGAAGAMGVDQQPIAHLTRVFGIARPFLEQGSYVLGTRWRIGDSASAAFATAFYTSVLGGEPVGEAVRKARTAIYDPESADLSWASYIYYGDPRLVIQLEVSQLDVDAPVAPVAPVGPVVHDVGLPAELLALAAEYEQIRSDEAESGGRTLKLESLVQPIRTAAAGLEPGPVVAALLSPDEGDRFVGVVAAREVRRPELMDALVSVLKETRSGFEEYHILATLLDAVDGFDEAHRTEVRDALLAKLEDDDFLTSDRAMLGREVLRKVAPSV